jgi:hypothetical protein
MTDPSEPAKPVFVDRTGRRRRWFGVLATSGGGLLVIATLVLVAGFLGAGGSLPALPGSGPGAGPTPGDVVATGVPGSPSHRTVRPTAAPSGTRVSTPAAVVTPTLAATPTPTPSPTVRHPHPTPSHKR